MIELLGRSYEMTRLNSTYRAPISSWTIFAIISYWQTIGIIKTNLRHKRLLHAFLKYIERMTF